MKVCILLEANWDGDFILGVYATHEAAKKALAEYAKDSQIREKDLYIIEEDVQE